MISIYDNQEIEVILHRADITASPSQTDFFDCTGFERVLFMVEADGTQIDAWAVCKLVQGTDSGGSAQKDVANGAISSAGRTAFNADLEKMIIEFDPIALDGENGYAFAALELDAGAGNDFVTVIAIGIPHAKNDRLNSTKVEKIVIP